MGQKVNPISFRISVTRDWDSKWFANKRDFGKWLHEDIELRKYIRDNFFHIAISRVIISRSVDKLLLDIYTARPSMLSSSNRKSEYDIMYEGIRKISPKNDIVIEIHEVSEPDGNAQLVSESIATQLEKRIGFRKVIKKAMQMSMTLNSVHGIKVKIGGRIGGAELARTEKYMEGTIPLHTIESDIQYGFCEANTEVGKIGIKIWICKKTEKDQLKNGINAKKDKIQKGAQK